MNIRQQEELLGFITARTFKELANMAIVLLREISRHNPEIVQICGPMSTGGCGDLKKNMERFQRSVEVAIAHGLVVFNQAVFQNAMIRICDWKEGNPYPSEILEIFYKEIFQSGYIRKGLFLPGWQGSVGARWEHDYLEFSGIPVADYPAEWLAEIDQ